MRKALPLYLIGEDCRETCTTSSRKTEWTSTQSFSFNIFEPLLRCFIHSGWNNNTLCVWKCTPQRCWFLIKKFLQQCFSLFQLAVKQSKGLYKHTPPNTLSFIHRDVNDGCFTRLISSNAVKMKSSVRRCLFSISERRFLCQCSQVFSQEMFVYRHDTKN